MDSIHIHWKRLVVSFVLASILATTTFYLMNKISSDSSEPIIFSVRGHTDCPGIAQLYYDLGGGLKEDLSQRIAVTTKGEGTLLKFNLPPQTIYNLRFDPIEWPAHMEFWDARLQQGENITFLPLSCFRAINQISVLRIEQDRLVVETTQDANDPMLAVDIPYPIEPLGHPGNRENILKRRPIALAILGILWSGVYALMGLCLRSRLGDKIRLIASESESRLGGFHVAVIALGFVKTWSVSYQQGIALGSAGYDDLLGMKLARSILEGNWLGTYDNLTLMKGPMYSIWLSLNFLIGTPLLFAQQCLYLVACAAMIYALRPIFQNSVLLMLGYALLLFNPISYDGWVAERLYRTSIYPSLTLLSLATLCGICTRRGKSLLKMTVWALSFGLAFSVFWFLREEGVVLLPSVFLVIGYTVVKLVIDKPHQWEFRLGVCTIPIVAFVLCYLSIATLNFIKYGIFVTNEWKTAEFKAAYGAINRVNHREWRQYVPVPKETRERIYQESPSFLELKPCLEGPLIERYAKYGQDYLAPGPRDYSGWWIFALRNAVAAAGYYNSGQETLRYYSRLADEINCACADERLKCGPKHQGLVPTFRNEYVPAFSKAFWRSALVVIRFEGLDLKKHPSSGSDAQLDLFRDISRERLAPRQTDPTPNLPNQERLDNVKRNMLSHIITYYKWTMPILFVVSLALYLVGVIVAVVKRRLDEFLMLATAALSGIFGFIFVVSLMNATLGLGHIGKFYQAPCFPLVIVFCMLIGFRSASAVMFKS